VRGLVYTERVNQHDEKLRRSWQTCRSGLSTVVHDAKLRAEVLAWLKSKRDVTPYYRVWTRILEGAEPDLVADLEGIDEYFDLSEEQRGRWRPLVQSHPFVVLRYSA
jgi:hypothetical protein